MQIKLHHVNLTSKDVPGMDEFYREVLDLKADPAPNAVRNISPQGYAGNVSFLSDGNLQLHLAEQDLGVSFRTHQSLNPLERGHIAFRTDDIEAFKKRLEEKGIPFADYGKWAMNGWYQVFFQDPAGNIIEVHQVDPEG